MSEFSLNFPNNSALVTPLPALDPVVPTSELKPPTAAAAIVVIDAHALVRCVGATGKPLRR